MVVDYVLLNSRTIKARWPLPRADDIFDSMSGAKFFSKIDLASGFYQISVSVCVCYSSSTAENTGEVRRSLENGGQCEGSPGRTHSTTTVEKTCDKGIRVQAPGKTVAACVSLPPPKTTLPM